MLSRFLAHRKLLDVWARVAGFGGVAETILRNSEGIGMTAPGGQTPGTWWKALRPDQGYIASQKKSG
jgi:hypothetical protein